MFFVSFVATVFILVILTAAEWPISEVYRLIKCKQFTNYLVNQM